MSIRNTWLFVFALWAPVAFSSDEVNEQLPGETPIEAPEEFVADPGHGDGFLKVIGAPGEGQRDYFGFTRCRIEEDRLQRLSCRVGEQAVRSAYLNRSIPLRPGHYLLSYERSVRSGWITIEEGKTTRVHLARVRVPAQEERLLITLYPDLTNQNELRKLGLWQWGSAHSYFERAHQLCASNPQWDRPGSLFGENYCEPTRTRDFESFLKRSFLVQSDGGVSTIHFTYDNRNARLLTQPVWKRNPLQRVAETQDGRLVSLFPGTYAIRFVRAADGAQVLRLGVEVLEPEVPGQELQILAD